MAAETVVHNTYQEPASFVGPVLFLGRTTMRYRLIPLLLALFCLCAFSTTPADETTPASIFQSELIFTPQELHCHSSSIVECPNGDLLVAWYRGSGERWANDVRIEGSRKRAGSAEWESMFLMADVPGFPDCNSALFIDPRGTLWLFWPLVLDNHWESALLRVRTSTEYMNDGAPVWRWQDDALWLPNEHFSDDLLGAEEWLLSLLPEDHAEYERYRNQMLANRENVATPLNLRLGWMPRVHPIMYDSTRMIVPLYSDRFHMSLMAITEDWGETWHASRLIVGPKGIQPTLFQKRDGTLVAYMRDASPIHRVQKSVSTDRGETWTRNELTEFANPSSSVDGVVLQNGHWVMLLNDTEQNRYRLGVILSKDEGETWSEPRYVDNDPTPHHSYHYPSVIQTRDGMIHVTYTWDDPIGHSIKHAAFNEAWIEAEE